MINETYVKCCGCRACEQICPTKAINMNENSEGFVYPSVDRSLCIKCGLCLKTCDFNDPESNSYYSPIKGYAAVSRDLKILNTSSSGGAFACLCRAIDPDAIIYGCAFGENLKVRHVRLEGIKEIYKCQKSKYVQSDTNNSFSLVKADLNEGRTVIYSGTPCQVAGLKAFLGKEYNRLYTIGLICHGVPSQKFFDSYIEYLNARYKMNITNYSFRDKQSFMGETAVGISFGDKKHTKRFLWSQDYFMNLYLKGRCYRKECYECKYANTDIQRPEDITIGDSWKIQETIPELDDKKGVSTIFFQPRENTWFCRFS